MDKKNRPAQELPNDPATENENIIQDLLLANPDAMFLIDLRGNILAVNEALASLFGKTPAGMVGTCIFSYLPVHIAEKAKTIQDAVARTGEVHVFETEWNKRYFSGRMCPVFNEKGEVFRIAVLMADISPMKKVEHALRESEAHYRKLVENISDVIFSIDTEGIITYISPVIDKLHGYKPSELIGQSFKCFIHPPDLPELWSNFQNTLRGIPCPSEFRIQMKSGELRWVRTSDLPMVEGTKVSGLQGVLTDIQERKLSHDALRESEEKFRTLSESTRSAILIHQDDRWVCANPAAEQISGYTREELYNMNFWDIVHPDWKNGTIPFGKARQRGEQLSPNHFELMIVTKYSEHKWLDMTGDTIIFRGRPASIVTAFDITERKNTETKLKETLENLRKAIHITIQVMSLAVESRDPFTAGHQKRTSDLARTIATEMGLTEDKIDAIRMAGLIHDIGKLSIPSEILSKPTILFPVEYEILKTHAKSGYDILKCIESPWPLAEIVYQHHERINGSGYPRKLKGIGILIEARIIAVADVVEAMSTHRPYRPAMNLDIAIEEIEKNSGILYDPDVVNACMKVFREKGYTFK